MVRATQKPRVVKRGRIIEQCQQYRKQNYLCHHRRLLPQQRCHRVESQWEEIAGSEADWIAIIGCAENKFCKNERVATLNKVYRCAKQELSRAPATEHPRWLSSALLND